MAFQFEWAIIALLLVLLILLLIRNHKVSAATIEREAGILFENWKAEELPRVRKEAIKNSQAVTKGKSLEHLLPYFGEFPYNPQDVRFLGSPIDLVVFDGLSEGQLRKVVFIEVKTGKKVVLPQREKAVKACIQERRVAWELLHYQQ